MLYTCRICNHQNGNKTYQVREMRLGLREEFTYFQCADCECLQIAAFPDDLAKYYPSDYYSFASVGNTARIGKVSKFLRTMRLRHKLQRPSIAGAILTRMFGTPDLPGPFGRMKVHPDARILDYGCGAGNLLCRLAAKGYVNLTGADPFVQAPLHYPNGVTVHKADITEVRGMFDFITLNHSFEHMPRPREILAALKDHLAPNGRLLIRIPILSSYAWRHYRENWVQLDAPRHFYLHSLKSIQRLTDQAGLIAESITFDSDILQFWGSEQYMRDIPLQDSRSFGENPSASIFSADEIAGFTIRTNQLNDTGDGDQIALLLKLA